MLSLWCLFSKWFVGNRQHSTNQQARWQATDRRRFHSHYSPHSHVTNYSLTMGGLATFVGLVSPHLLLTHYGRTSYLVGLISPHLLLTPLSSCGLSARLWCGNTLHHCLTLFLPSFHRCKNVFTFVYNNSLYFLFFQRFLLWTLWQQQCKHINTITNKNVFYIIHSFDK